MQRKSRWTLATPNTEAADLAGRLRVSRVLAQILLNRGYAAEGVCLDFLRPSLKHLHDPSTLPGLLPAAERIARAVRDREPIAIYGDYDVDGITASAILYHALLKLGASVRTYIPHRVDEGYGLNAEAVTTLCDEGVKLIVTVDCGVTATGPAKVAAERGVDLVITDHHEWKETDGVADLPHAAGIVHPRLGAVLGMAEYPNPHLCGAGVAFKVAWGVGKALLGEKVGTEFRELLVEMTALCALGTIADVVPLVGENRVIASFGLQCLPKSKLTGIRALLASANLLGGEAVDAFHVGFMLAPRLNAAGRMGHAREALEMLTTADEARAHEIAAELETQNRTRQTTEKKTLEEVLAEIARLGDDADTCHGILLAGKGWHPGVIGIVASRVVDRFHRPTVLVSLQEELGAGSGRSIAGFHLAKALHHCTDLLVSHGGHEMAAGLKVRPENVDALRERFQTHCRSVLAPELLTPELKLDCETELSEMTMAMVNEMARLGPFGHGNRKPLLACTGVELAQAPRRVGKTGDHLQLTLRQNGVLMKGIAFNKGDLADTLRPGQKIDLAVEPSLNEWNGRVSVEVQIRDVRV